MTTEIEQIREETREETIDEKLRKQPLCGRCGGRLAKFPEPEAFGDGIEVRCLMCARVAFRDPGYLMQGDLLPMDDEDTKVNIRLSRPAARYLKQLLAETEFQEDEAFRIEKTEVGANVQLSRKRPGDMRLPRRGEPLLFLSRSAARELDGASIKLEDQDGDLRITIKNPAA